MILLPNTSIEGATIVAQNIRKLVEEKIIELEDSSSLKITVSLGVSSVDIKNELNIEIALKRADDALYQAKETGRNKVCIIDFLQN